MTGRLLLSFAVFAGVLAVGIYTTAFFQVARSANLRSSQPVISNCCPETGRADETNGYLFRISRDLSELRRLRPTR